jgi:hypothetical protein
MDTVMKLPPPPPETQGPPPLLHLAENLSAVFQTQVLERLNPTDRTLLARVSRAFRDAVEATGLPRAGRVVARAEDQNEGGGDLPLELKDFCTSVELLAWAKAGGGDIDDGVPTAFNKPAFLPSFDATGNNKHKKIDACLGVSSVQSANVSEGQTGAIAPSLDTSCTNRTANRLVCFYAKDNGCPWTPATCRRIVTAGGGSLELLQWARAHGCELQGRGACIINYAYAQILSHVTTMLCY